MNVKLVFLAESCKLEVENFQKHKFLYFSTFRHAFRCNLSLRAKRSNPKFLPAITGFPLQSWLKFTNSFSFHFSKLPRQNFLQKFCHPFKEGEFFTFSTLKTIDARFARAKKHLQNLSLLRSSTSKRTIFLQTFFSYGTFFLKLFYNQNIFSKIQILSNIF